MDSTDIFVRAVLYDKVKLGAEHVNGRLDEMLIVALKNKYEGICSHYGYIKPGSISLYKHTLGMVQAASLNGDVQFGVNFHADVCNPCVGSIVHSQAVNVNKFGILAQSGFVMNGQFTPVLEVIIAKNMATEQHDVSVDEISPGDQFHVEILGKKFELNDRKISAVGKIINSADKDANTLDDVDDNNLGRMEMDDNDDSPPSSSGSSSAASEELSGEATSDDDEDSDDGGEDDEEDEADEDDDEDTRKPKKAAKKKSAAEDDEDMLASDQDDFMSDAASSNEMDYSSDDE